MKHIKYAVTIVVLLYATRGYSQSANTALSNLLSPTAVNQVLLPQTDNTLNIGSATKSWKNLYLDGSLYLNSNRFLSNGGNTNNLFAGNKAGNSTTGAANTFIGAFAGFSNTTGHDNTAIGYFSMYANAITYQNTAIGSLALFTNSSGYYNTAIGFSALHDNLAGFYNTAVGNLALNATLTSGNTALGERAGAIYKNGWGNTFIGQQTWANADGYEYSTCIGYNSRITASNQVRIGSSTVTSIGGYRAWSNLSDGRYKKNIKEDVPGLVFINKLRPITYTLDIQAINLRIEHSKPGSAVVEKPSTYSEIDKYAIAEQEKIISTGFMAQEVEKAAKDLNFQFDGVDAPKNENDFYALRYSEFVVPLVKAVQELDAENKDLKARIEKLEHLVKGATTFTTSNSAYLEQNTPNPVNGATTIRYQIPEQSISARLTITNSQGQLIKAITLNHKGAGQLNLNIQALAAGTYNYTLYVDGKQVDTKRLLIVR